MKYIVRLTPEHEAIARYLSTLNRTAIRYRRARVQEFTARPRNLILAVPSGWPSNHTRVLAYMLATVALGTRAPWGNEL
jgi:hypothetical protein